MKILLIDDSSMMRRLIKRALANLEGVDMEVLEASDGMEALSRIREEGVSFDLILCDLNMPMISGLSLLKILRNLPDMKGIPIVVITADASGEGARQAVQAGAVAVLGKPFRPEAVLEIIRSRGTLRLQAADVLQGDPPSGKE